MLSSGLNPAHSKASLRVFQFDRREGGGEGELRLRGSVEEEAPDLNALSISRLAALVLTKSDIVADDRTENLEGGA